MQASALDDVAEAPVRPSFAAYRRQIDRLLDQYIAPGRPVALLHYPYDGNVGNHMMWVGTTDYLIERKAPISYVAHANNFRADDLARVIGDGAILFLGGVTISRLWPQHAAMKSVVAQRFPENPLISLPATVLFADDDDMRQAGGIFGTHRNATVMTRDPISERQARQAFPPHVRVLTVPDVALRLPAQPRRSNPVRDIIWLARDDLEGVGFAPPPSVHVFDWPQLHDGMPAAHYLLRTSGVFSRLRSSKLGAVAAAVVNAPMARLYRYAAIDVLRRGNAILDAGKVLVTDRMHPHVLAALRGQPVVLLPDKFGKNRAVYDHYTKSFPTVFWADSPARGLELAEELAQKQAASFR